MSRVAYALVDGNNFYVACERVFNPALEGRAVIVLSNNDACVVSRSEEAKALDIRMGQPYFEIRARFARAGGVALSSNYALYADLSRRLMAVAGQFAAEQEIYSIDECFLRWRGRAAETPTTPLAVLAARLRARVRQWTGLPVGVGIGATKTLAKLANRLAKRHPAFKAGGVCDLDALTAADRDACLAGLAAGDVWGVGARTAHKLALLGIHTALELRRADPTALRRRFGVTMERTVRELNGQSCLALTEAPPPHQQIVSTRGFGAPVTEKADLLEAVAAYAAVAGRKLRRDGLTARALQVLLTTNPFIPDEPQYHPAILLTFAIPTQDTGHLIHAAQAGLEEIYRPGLRYKKAGVMLLDLAPAHAAQGDLFGNAHDDARRARLAAVVDRLNAGRGRPRLTYAAEGLAQPWRMRRDTLTPAYTTAWDELPVGHAGGHMNGHADERGDFDPAPVALLR